jgi:hypothetical protein
MKKWKVPKCIAVFCVRHCGLSADYIQHAGITGGSVAERNTSGKGVSNTKMTAFHTYLKYHIGTLLVCNCFIINKDHINSNRRALRLEIYRGVIERSCMGTNTANDG